ncbi:hypothetical protein ACFL4W_00845 [Planctomycetota bacterium]
MALCEKCGREVKKLTEHAQSKEKLCLKCITKSGFFIPKEEELEVQDERRASIRVPITIIMGFTLFDDDQKTEIKYPAFSVDISTAGICFAWDSCSYCRGYIENGIHESCIFYPYALDNPERQELKLEFKITKTYVMTIESYCIYTLKEESLGLEYIGAQFANLTNQQRRMLEKIIIKYGASI